MLPYMISLILFVASLVLLPLGRIFGLPLKAILFLSTLLMFMYGYLKKKIKVEFDRFTWFILFYSLLYPLIWGIIAKLNHVPKSLIFNRANVFLMILLILFTLKALNEYQINKVFRVFMYAAFFNCILLVGLRLFYQVAGIYGKCVLREYIPLLDQGGNISINENGFVRIILRSNVFLPFDYFFIIANRKLIKKKWVFAVMLAFNLAALLISFTKAFLIAVIFGTVLLIILERRTFKDIIKKVLLWIKSKLPGNISNKAFKTTVCAVVVILVAAVLCMPVSRKFYKQMMLVFDKNLPSNQIRVEQCKFLTDNIKKNVLMGKGLGARGTNYHFYYYRDYSKQDYFELSYVHLIFQTGIIGFILYALFLVMPILVYCKSYKYRNGRFGRSAVICGYIGYLFYAGTNPYLFDSSGLLIIVLSYLLLLYNNKIPIKFKKVVV